MLDSIENEVTPAAGGEAPAPAEPAAPPEPTEPVAEPDAPEEGAPEGEAAPQEPEFDEGAFRALVAEEAQAIVQAQMQHFLPQFGQQQQTGTAQQGGFDWSQIDPYSEDFGAQLGQGIQAAITQAIAPVTTSIQAQQDEALLSRGEQYAQDMIADEISRNGDFATDEKGEQPSKALVRPLANMLMPQFVGRYGESPRAAEHAIEQAAQLLRAVERVSGEVALRKERNHVATLAGVQGEPGSGAVTALPGMPASPLSARALAEKYAASA